MPLLKANEPLPERPVIILLYGEPGIGKTSLFNTSQNPLLIDFDRGKDRAIFRKDTIVVNTWEDIDTEEKAGTFKNYGTIGIDTAKACLDDFLMSYVVKKDFKNAKNKLAAYGAIGDEFKIFVSNRRSESADIVIIAHSKDEKDGEAIKKVPDVTGGSYQLLLRIADQVGYMSMKNNKRTIQFEPTDNTVGKNVARLPLIQIPNETDPEIHGFMQTVIDKVKKSICSQSESQREALEKSKLLQDEINVAKSIGELLLTTAVITELPQYLQAQIAQVLSSKALSLVPAIKTADELNEAFTLFNTKPLTLKQAQVEIKKVQDANGFKFDQAKKQFYSPAPPPPYKDELKDRIPGASVMDEAPATELFS